MNANKTYPNFVEALICGAGPVGLKQYRHGRVFLAGDAAHIHSPMGGQGMNMGIQDVYNLVWKIGLVQKGYGSDALLESYSAEREPIAAELLKTTDRMTKVAKTRNVFVQKIRNRIVPLVAGTEMVQEKMIRAMSEVDLRYPESPITSENWRGSGGELSTGDRTPDATLLQQATGAQERVFELLKDTRFMLLLFGGDNATDKDYRGLRRIAREIREDYGNCVDVRYVAASTAHLQELQGDATPILLDTLGTAHERYGATAMCLYLIRPDGYVAYRSLPADCEDLLVYLGGIFPQKTLGMVAEKVV